MDTNVANQNVVNASIQAPNTTNTNDVFSRLGIAEFKQQVGASSLEILRNLKTEEKKLFVGASNGKAYKCQQNIDTTKPMEFLIVNGIIEDACLINKGNKGAEVLMEL